MTIPLEVKKEKVEWGHPVLSITRQCELLSLSKGALYYEPVPMDTYNLMLMDLLDREYLEHPFYGARKMVVALDCLGHHVNVKRIGRLMRLMGIQTIYPKKKISIPDANHPHYPYLLKDLTIDHPDQVWCSDITYLKIGRGFVYLTAVMDWYSRYVLSWGMSNSLMTNFCIDTLIAAFEQGKPEIFNTDQGSQYTSREFVNHLQAREIRISMDSRGRYYDNIMIERLWRTVKYEEIYLKGYGSVREARDCLGEYFSFYNQKRFHQSLDYKTPQEVYLEKKEKELKKEGSTITQVNNWERSDKILTKKT